MLIPHQHLARARARRQLLRLNVSEGWLAVGLISGISGNGWTADMGSTGLDWTVGETYPITDIYDRRDMQVRYAAAENSTSVREHT